MERRNRQLAEYEDGTSTKFEPFWMTGSVLHRVGDGLRICLVGAALPALCLAGFAHEIGASSWVETTLGLGGYAALFGYLISRWIRTTLTVYEDVLVVRNPFITYRVPVADLVWDRIDTKCSHWTDGGLVYQRGGRLRHLPVVTMSCKDLAYALKPLREHLGVD